MMIIWKRKQEIDFMINLFFYFESSHDAIMISAMNDVIW